MSLDFLNNNIQLDDFSSDEYLQEIISPIIPSESKRSEVPVDNQNIMDNNTQDIKYNPMISYVDQSTFHPQMNNVLPNNMVLSNNMLKHRLPSQIPQQNLPFPQMINIPSSNNMPPMIVLPIKIVQAKRKIAESTPNLQLPRSNNNDLFFDDEEEESSPTKKSKKSKASKKSTKKDLPKRKRVNYCFEIHRSGCSLNKDAKLYCKVFLKGKLQSEVDLIKGARGKWAYTFYDQRKKKKERRYWPSQSSGPIIEDPCNCDKCIPSTIDEEVDFSSPSSEDVNLLNEYEQIRQKHFKSEFNTQQPQIIMAQYGNQVVYYPTNYHPNEIVQDQYNQYVQIVNPEYAKNFVLKSSNDFQDNRFNYLKSSNDFANHQRPWEQYLQNNNVEYLQNNNVEYGNDGLFVENNFL